MSILQPEKIRNLMKILLHPIEHPKGVGIASQIELASFFFCNPVRSEMDRHFLVRDPGPAEIQLDPHAAVGRFPEEADVFFVRDKLQYLKIPFSAHNSGVGQMGDTDLVKRDVLLKDVVEPPAPQFRAFLHTLIAAAGQPAQVKVVRGDDNEIEISVMLRRDAYYVVDILLIAGLLAKPIQCRWDSKSYCNRKSRVDQGSFPNLPSHEMHMYRKKCNN